MIPYIAKLFYRHSLWIYLCFLTIEGFIYRGYNKTLNRYIRTYFQLLEITFLRVNKQGSENGRGKFLKSISLLSHYARTKITIWYIYINLILQWFKINIYILNLSFHNSAWVNFWLRIIKFSREGKNLPLTILFFTRIA